MVSHSPAPSSNCGIDPFIKVREKWESSLQSENYEPYIYALDGFLKIPIFPYGKNRDALFAHAERIAIAVDNLLFDDSDGYKTHISKNQVREKGLELDKVSTYLSEHILESSIGSHSELYRACKEGVKIKKTPHFRRNFSYYP